MFYFTVTKVDEGGAKIFDNGKVVEKQTTMFVVYPKPRYNGGQTREEGHQDNNINLSATPKLSLFIAFQRKKLPKLKDIAERKDRQFSELGLHGKQILLYPPFSKNDIIRTRC